MIRIFDSPSYDLRYTILHGDRVFLASDTGTVESAGHDVPGLTEQLRKISKEIRADDLPGAVLEAIKSNLPRGKPHGF